MIGSPAKNCLQMFAHDSQVFCGQTSGRELGSGISWFSHPWTTPDIRQEVCEDKAVGSLDQGKHKKESKLLAESLKTNRIKQQGEAPRKIIQKSTSCTVFIALETFMLAANPSLDRQAACRLNQSLNHRLKSAFGPQGRRFLLPFSQPPEVSRLRSTDATRPSPWPYSFTAVPSAQLQDKNDKFCPLPWLRWGRESWMLIA